MPTMDIQECDQCFTLDELRTKAKAYGLVSSGSKKELCERLIRCGAFDPPSKEWLVIYKASPKMQRGILDKAEELLRELRERGLSFTPFQYSEDPQNIYRFRDIPSKEVANRITSIIHSKGGEVTFESSFKPFIHRITYPIPRAFLEQVIRKMVREQKSWDEVTNWILANYGVERVVFKEAREIYDKEFRELFGL